MSKRLEIKIGGVGGQGVVYAANLIGLTLSHKKGFVAVSASYGPESRGSITTSEIVFSGKPIDYPHVEGIDILIAMHKLAYIRFAERVRKGGFIIVDSFPFSQAKNKKLKSGDFRVAPCKHYFIPASHLVQKETGAITMSNLILVGGLIRITKITTPTECIKSLKEFTSAENFPLNLKALKIGLDYKF